MLRREAPSPGQWKSVLDQVHKCLEIIMDKAKAVATAHWIINRYLREGDKSILNTLKSLID